MRLWTSLVTVVGCSLVCSFNFRTAHSVRPQFRTFEDFLQRMDKNMQSSIITLEGGSGLSSTAAAVDKTDRPMTSALVQEDKNVTCCLLGELAGDKGFHCFVQFYAARIVLRNMNRAHTKKLGFYGRSKIPRYGKKLMKTFEQCVAGHGKIFHKCCHLAKMERKASTTPTKTVA